MADKRIRDMTKEDTTVESLAEGLGQLDLKLDGTAETNTETDDEVQYTPQTRYNLRSRKTDNAPRKPNQSQAAVDSNTGIKQDTTKACITPNLRGSNTGKSTGKDLSKTTARQFTTDSNASIRPRTRQRVTGNNKPHSFNASASTFQPQVANNAQTTWDNFFTGSMVQHNGRLAPPTPPKSIKSPHKPSIKRPSPSAAYLEKANQAMQTLDSPRQLLVVLDLNGTLLHRQPKGGSTFVARPKVNEFLHYLLANHRVMVWSSARPENVNSMCEKLFDKEQHQRLVAVWARNTLRLPRTAYNTKAQVYKQLSWVWEDDAIQSANLNPTGAWDQSNTVLIDDSAEKAASEPHNLICLERFEDRPEQQRGDVLGQVVKYLEMLKLEQDVSACMRAVPFKFEPGEVFDWRV